MKSTIKAGTISGLKCYYNDTNQLRLWLDFLLFYVDDLRMDEYDAIHRYSTPSVSRIMQILVAVTNWGLR